METFSVGNQVAEYSRGRMPMPTAGVLLRGAWRGPLTDGT